jgi:hypothetical protein
MAMLSEGTYSARAQSMTPIRSSEKGTEGIAVVFMILDEGPFKNKLIEWTGWLSEKTRERTAESLVLCGFDGENEDTIKKNVVSLEVEHEVNPENGKTYAKVAWVNDPNRARSIHKPLDGAEKSEAFSRLRGLVVAKKLQLDNSKSTQTKKASDSFNFGANDNSSSAPKPVDPANEPKF